MPDKDQEYGPLNYEDTVCKGLLEIKCPKCGNSVWDTDYQSGRITCLEDEGGCGYWIVMPAPLWGFVIDAYKEGRESGVMEVLQIANIANGGGGEINKLRVIHAFRL